jgi:hypothetical protein
MIVKIQDKPYNYKYKIEELTLDDYLTIIEILNEDQYDTYIDQHTNKEVKRREPRPKDERDDEFIFNTYRNMVKHLSTIPLKYLKEDEVISTLVQYLSPVFQKIADLQQEIEDNDELYNEEFPTFTFKEKKLSFQPIQEWSFYKWVTLETFLTKGLSNRVIDDEGYEIITQVIKGNRYILPLLFDELSIGFDEDLKYLDDKFNFFNKETSLVTTYKIFIRILHLINEVKKVHSFIYNESSVSKGHLPNMDKHSQDFGWLSTLVDIAEKGVFGTYSDVKKSNLIQVLEYLNCSCSKNAAEANDAELK